MTDPDLNDIIEASKPCRGCGHIRIAHKFIEKGSDKMHCIDAILNERGKYKVCQCEDFAPKDNLDFLEWKHTRKKK